MALRVSNAGRAGSRLPCIADGKVGVTPASRHRFSLTKAAQIRTFCDGYTWAIPSIVVVMTIRSFYCRVVYLSRKASPVTDL